MKITLLHPTRGRANQAFQTFQNWKSKCSNWANVQHILSIDNDDREKFYYQKSFAETGSMICIHDNTNVVQATNNAAPHAQGDILIYLSDDFDCPQNWDLEIINRVQDKSKPWLLKVDDCLQKFDADVLTIPIMSKLLYQILGHFWHPSYRSMFCDQDLFYTVKINNWILNAPELKFQHNHYCNGRAKKDETYTRSDANWNHGKATYNERKKQNFPL